MSGPSTRPEYILPPTEPMAGWFRVAALVLAVLAALAGGAHLAAWLAGVMAERGFTQITMKANTGLAILLLGVSLALRAADGPGRALRVTASVCAGLALLIGALTLSENVFGWDLGIDQLLAEEPPGALGVEHPNRMGPPASLAFVLAGAALLGLDRRRRTAQALALGVCLIGLLSAVGFLYNVAQFYAITRLTAIAWPTALALLGLGLGTLCARPGTGLMALVAADDAGGRALRRLVLASTLLPLGLGYLRLVGERMGLYDAAMGTELLMLVFVVSFTATAYFVSLGISRRQAARRQAEEALRQSEARYSSLFHNSHAVMLLIDPADGQIVDANQAACAFYGYDEAQIKAMRITQINTLSPEQVRQAMQRARDGRQRAFEFRHRLASGEVRDVETYSGTIQIQGRDLLYSIVHDVTARKDAEHARHQLTAELTRSNQDLEQFAYVASHDLREPLRMITGFMGLLKERYGEQVGEEGREFISYAVDGAERMQGLLSGLLEYSRVTTQRRQPEPVAMGEAFDIALANLWQSVQDTGAEVSADELPTVRADPTQMAQLLQNLIANGLKFRRPDVPPRVHVGVQRQQGQWQFCVSDNGIGIEPTQAERVFVIFQRLHTRDQYEGSGIGLAICKKIVERHGGQIWVQSTPGEGSTFYFALPAED